MSDHNPRVTIGVPVFNGEAFLAETIDSLLNQTFSDFEVVISDNASTDRTEQICRAYAARDPRIRYYRSDINRGAGWNHNRVFELARGEFFKWNSADDLCVPEFLARCVAALDRDPSAVMVMPNAVEIGQRGEHLGATDLWGSTLLPLVPSAAPPHVRFRQNIRMNHLCATIYGLIRSQVLRQTELIGSYPDADRNLLAHLALFGPCVVVPEVLFLNRDHPGRYSRVFQDDWFCGWREWMIWYDPTNASRKMFPFSKKCFELYRIVARTRIGPWERIRCYWVLVQWLLKKDNILRFYNDATYYPRKFVVRRFPWAKIAWNWLWGKGKGKLQGPSRNPWTHDHGASPNPEQR